MRDVMFVYSLPILFNQIDLMSVPEALFIIGGLFALLWILAPVCSEEAGRWTRENYLFSCWTGRQGLSAAFWPFFLLLNAALFGVDWLARSGLWTVSSWDDVHFVLLLPVIWWTASTWRCSAHAELRLYAAGARFATLGVFIEYGLKLYIRIEYPRLFFNCEDTLLNYGSCF
jgi:hypothetical protein